MRYILSYAVLALISISVCYSQIPQTLSWQGILQDANGNNLNGSYNLTVKLYDVSSSGTALWSETYNAVSISNGLANLSLGSVTPFNFNFDKQYWIEITIGNGTPLSRIKLSSVPYSLYSAKSSGVIVNDSLVLKDAQGVTRMVLNPNTGTFKMMNNDTTWYETSVQSPRSEYMMFYNGSTYEKIYNSNGSVTKIKDADGNIIHKEIETKIQNNGSISHTIIKEDYFNDIANDKYYLYKRTTEINNTTQIDKSEEITKKVSEELFNENNIIESKNEVEYKTLPKIESEDGRAYSDKFTKYNYDENGNEVGRTLEVKEYNANGSRYNAKETYKNNVLIYREFEIPDGSVLKRKKIVEYFDDNGNKISSENKSDNPNEKTFDFSTINYDNNGNVISEMVQTFDGNSALLSTIIKQGIQGTKLSLSKNNVSFSNLFSNKSVIINQEQSTGHININQIIGSTETTIARIRGDNPGQIDLGPTSPNGNIELTNNMSRFYGSTLFNGTLQVVDNVYLNSNTYLKNLYAYGNVTIGTSSQPNDIEVKGNSTIKGNGYFDSELYVSGNANFSSNVNINGNININNANISANSLYSSNDISAKGAKKFVIDHPTDNTKLIQHAAIESNGVFNQYMGNVTTDANSLATITLPSYFASINNQNEIFYQLTVMSLNFVQAIVISGYDEETNSFTIKTSSPNTQVSWQVTAKRNDNYMQSNPFYDVINK